MKAITGIVELGASILDKVIPDPIEKTKAQAELIRQQQAGQFKELDARMEAIVAEAKSKDPWTSRSRPSFLYVMYVMILLAVPMGFLAIFQPDAVKVVVETMKMWLEAIPTEMWGLFAAGYLGYTANRSADKARLVGVEPKPGLLSKLLG